MLAFFILFYVYSLQLQPAAALWPKFICVTGMALSAANIVISGVKWQKRAGPGDGISSKFRANQARHHPRIYRRALDLCDPTGWLFELFHVIYWNYYFNL